MKYVVRINKKAWNPITGKVIESRVWEVEQVANPDSEKVVWHRHNVVIRRAGVDTPIQLEIARNAANAPLLPKQKVTDVELTFFGIAINGADDSVVIDVRNGHDVS